MFLFGTDDKIGAIRLSRFPFSNENNEIFEIQSHYKGIRKLKVSFDDNYIFSAGDDGAIIIYEVKEKDAKIKLDKDGSGMQFADEFLMSRDKYSEELKIIEDLK